jgi:hypothetical protein
VIGASRRARRGAGARGREDDEDGEVAGRDVDRRRRISVKRALATVVPSIAMYASINALRVFGPATPSTFNFTHTSRRMTCWRRFRMPHGARRRSSFH